MKILPEVKIFYNVQDDRYYIYFGEDYVIDTKNKDLAINIFYEQCIILKNIYLLKV